MKKYFFLTISCILLLSGCDILEAPYKKEASQFDTPRKVLLEYYTGHLCINCPDARKIINDIEESNGDNIVLIAVHAGDLAKPFGSEFSYNFTTETGNIWYDFFGFSAVPNGMINRKERSGSRVISTGNWSAVTLEQISLPVEAEISLTAVYDSATRFIDVKTLTNVITPKQGEKYTITVVLTEDSIVKPQKKVGGGTISDYVHNNVLRGSFTGPWGKEISSSVVQEEPFNMTLDTSSDIVPDNCRIVAFISNSKKEVLQAEEIMLIEKKKK